MLYDWNNAPEWAEFAARDANGFACWYSAFPTLVVESGYGIEWEASPTTKKSSNIDPFWNQKDCPEAVFSLEARDGTDAYLNLVGKDIFVQREDDQVFVRIFRNKIDNTYSFINTTKSHVCTCKFDTVKEALKDLHEQSIKNKVHFAAFIAEEQWKQFLEEEKINEPS